MTSTLPPTTGPRRIANRRVFNRDVVAWSMWDFGSAAFNAVLVTFIFSVYLTDSVGDSLGGSVSASTWYGAAIAVAGVIIAVTAPGGRTPRGRPGKTPQRGADMDAGHRGADAAARLRR